MTNNFLSPFMREHFVYSNNLSAFGNYPLDCETIDYTELMYDLSFQNMLKWKRGYKAMRSFHLNSTVKKLTTLTKDIQKEIKRLGG